MGTTSFTRYINAPAERVFDVVAHIENFKEAIPHITKIEYLTDQQSGVGTRFRETRTMKGRKATTELEVTEYEPNKTVRLVSDAGGTIWDTVFTTTPEDGGTTLDMKMDSRPYRLLSRLTLPLFAGMVNKAIAADMDAIKTYCE